MSRYERQRATADRIASLRTWVRAAYGQRAIRSVLPTWVMAVLAITVPSHALAIWRVVRDLPAGTRPPLRDSVIFEYIGWYMTRGGRVYVDVWDLKPPLAYEVPAVLAWFARGDLLVAHGLNVALTCAAAIGTSLAAGLLVKDLTGDAAAAFAAGIALYAVPAYHWRAAFGFKVKYFVPLFTLLAIYLARRERPGSAGVSAGIAMAFWQLTAIVPALVSGITAVRTGRRGVKRALTGTVGVIAIVILPVVFWGAVEAMVTETLLVPLLVGQELGASSPLTLSYRLLGAATPVVLVGVLGVAIAGWRRPIETWWLAAGTAWFGFQVIAIDLDSAPDLFPLLAFIAVGIGLLIGAETGRQRPVALLLAVFAVMSVATMGGFGLGTGPLYDPGGVTYDPDQKLAMPYTSAERDLLYWRGAEPATCRVFYGPTQHQLVQQTSLRPFQRTCGEAEPVLRALRDKWSR